MLWSFDRRQSLRSPGLGFLAAPAAAFRWQKAPRAPRTRYFCLFSLQERGGGAEGRGDRSARAGYLKSAANDPPDVLNERHKPLVRDPQFTDRRVLAHHRSRVVPRQRAHSKATSRSVSKPTRRLFGHRLTPHRPLDAPSSNTNGDVFERDFVRPTCN